MENDPVSEFITSSSLSELFNSAFKLSLSVGAILALLRIVWAGYQYMGSADMWSTKQAAKETLSDAIVGLLLLIGIWLILNVINPCILDTTILDTGQAGSVCRGAQNSAQNGQSGLR